MVKTNYEISEKKASSFGGLHAVSELLESLKFNVTLNEFFGKYRKVRKYEPADIFNILLATIFCGGEKLADIKRLNEDPVIPELFATGDVPFDTTIRNDLQKIGQRPDELREFLFRLNEFLLKRTGAKTMTIDIDSTATPVSIPASF